MSLLTLFSCLSKAQVPRMKLVSSRCISQSSPAVALSHRGCRGFVGNSSVLMVVLLFVVMCLCSLCVIPVESIICQSIDVRNSPLYFSQLENCTVIEGHLQIVLQESASPQDYANISFPKLTEITDYMLLYRVPGLVSLAKLFPNLSVIRGRNLFSDFALAVYEMTNLQELGLSNLTVIERGSVRVHKNPNLCFTETIDWDLIAKEGRGAMVIAENKPQAQCPPCHMPDSSRQCPTKSTSVLLKQEDRSSSRNQLCWKAGTCQRICSASCSSSNRTCYVNSTSTCCHEQCLGGCTGPDVSDCLACKKISYRGECRNKCPHSLYEYLGRRCVDWNECIQMTDKRPEGNISFKAFDPPPLKGVRRCIAECPAGFEELKDNKFRCERCHGRCPKNCNGGIISNVAQAQKFKGCTHIKGPLEISVRKHISNVVEELEKSLQLVEEITDYLKVVRSTPLITLHFFKNLRIIHGERLERESYSLLVLDNLNLQELFPWNITSTSSNALEQKLQIKKGKVFFHMNPKLCIRKIDELKTNAIVSSGDWDDHDVSPQSNGDRIACSFVDLNVSVVSIKPKVVIIQWKNFQNDLHDFRSLLGYLVYYREAPENVTMFEGMDACGTNSWNVLDKEVGSSRDTQPSITDVIPHLQPFRRYALYIKTYTIASEPKGGVTDIVYFWTKPTTPSSPVDVKARAVSSSEIVIEWKPPKKPYGFVTHYKITITKQMGDIAYLIDKRDYCQDPLKYKRLEELEDSAHVNYTRWLNSTAISTSTHSVPLDSDNPESTGASSSEKCCACSGNVNPTGEGELAEKISFEDYLQNSVYVKYREIKNTHMNNGKSLSKRSVSDGASPEQILGNDFLTTLSPDDESGLTNSTATEGLEVSLSNEPISKVFPADNHSTSFSFEVANLTHFSDYSITIMACHDESEIYQPCSATSMAYVRTLPLDGANNLADMITVVKTEKDNNITSSNLVELRWKEPGRPNGIIVSYHMEYKRLIGEKTELITKCVTRSKYLTKRGYDLTDLPSGNYSLRLRVSSTGGVSDYTAVSYFFVPDQDKTSVGFIVGIVVMAIVSTMVAFMFGAWFFMKKKMQGDPLMTYVSINPDYIPAYNPDEWEIDRKKVEKLHELGQGSFGAVYEGIVRGHNNQAEMKCAIKTVNDQASPHDRYEFLNEASVMKEFKCHHVVELIGVVSIGHPVYVLMELMSSGDLKTYLRRHRITDEQKDLKPPTLEQLYKMAAEIADGMAYLAAKKFVHRDLAGRNCMVAGDLTVKIGDFGMTRDIYETDYYRKGNKGLLPVRWMGPESLKDGVFTSQSDVWSFGVVLWEMVTLAMQPYQGLSNDQVLKFVVGGGVMEKPENCPEKTFTIMNLCWARNPKARPTFVEIIEMLLPDIEHSNFSEQSWYHTTWTPQKEKAAQAVVLQDVAEEEESETLNASSEPMLESSEQVQPSKDGSTSSSSTTTKFFPTALSLLTNGDNNSEDKYLQIEPDMANNLSAPAVPVVVETNQTNGGSMLRRLNGKNSAPPSSQNNQDNSKASIQSSDGSKGSKISTTSNGSVCNGHATHCTTEC